MEYRSYQEESKLMDLVQSFFMQVYGWMFLGLLTTGALAYYTTTSEFLLTLIFGNSYAIWVLLIAQLGLVVAISGAINSLSYAVAGFLFFIYSALMGLTLSSVFLVYTSESISTVFFITAATFGAVSIYGYFTKADLTKMGSILFMALIGLIIASVVNIFLQNPTIYWILSYAGVLIFVGLTAYDTQRLKNLVYSSNANEETINKLAIVGALTLYLDFINLFLYLLRIFGKRR